MSDPGSDLAARTASEVRVAVGRLHRRLRLVNEGGLSASQSSALARIVKGEADTAAALAALDGVRQQSMAATVAALEQDGLLVRSVDPADGRRSILRATPEGEALFLGNRAARQEWLSTALRERLDEAELATVLEAAALLQRLTEQ
ncbi:MarR family winged helix-turn-helix transcriptional regulator [Amnibacterium kyonggiense]|uniref:DNA-binding MarR family transcriptional regulator n=1 Tax=Amnibacterium kyonggiense TaxID=595671 RepID=A0A4R7FS29_9MICO|nr:MarR family winged helix-turn-helix transcriptional regulator [Amnibacterium kyonggiense]TDS80548.1 DNA-binding MarR family transcriptional regulator [Amnibacterium kyonggiense]